MNYENDLNIDPTRLDMEFLEQPSLYFMYSRNVADCQKELDLVSQEMDLVEAELDHDVRENLEKYGVVGKPTEANIKAAYISTTRYIDKNTELIEARHRLNVAKSAERAFEQRKVTLENMVRLYSSNYFAGPSTPRDLTGEWLEKEKNKHSDALVGKALNNRIRTK